MKLVVFDFCETLVSFQTGDAFVRYVIEQINSKTIQRRLRWHKWAKRTKWFLVVYLLNKRLHFRLTTSKLWYLRIIAGVTKEDIDRLAESYYKQYVVPNLIPETNELLQRMQQEGYETVLVSAGYAPYIQFYCQDHNIPFITNEFRYKDGHFTGKLLQTDCYGKDKVVRLKELYNLNNYEEIVNVSDSISDLPLFNIAKRKILVLRKGKNQQPPKGMEALFW